MNIGPAEPWLNVGAKLCENPLWDAASEALYWTDIPNGHIYRHAWATGETERIYADKVVGGFTLQADGSFLLFRERDVASYRPGEAPRTLASFEHEGSTRFNDVIADPEGRVFAGTIGRRGDSGGLFRMDLDGSLTQVAGGSGIANGMGFSPDFAYFYWVCSTRRRLHRFPYNRATGQLGDPIILFQGDEVDGYPDGMTVDSEGNLYSIRWGAKEHGLVVFDPHGKILHKAALPPRASSSATFCGPGLEHLAVTAADDSADKNREADLYLIREMPIAGREEHRSRIGL